MRRWFQIHLSTAILLMFVVGGLLWANLIPQRVLWLDSLGSLNVVGQQWYGWPSTGCKGWEEDSGVSAHYNENFIVVFPSFVPAQPVREYSVYPMGVLMDTFAATGLVLTSAMTFEWFIRRRGIRNLDC